MEEVKKIGWGKVTSCDVHINVLFNGELMIFVPRFDPNANECPAAYVQRLDPDTQRGMDSLKALLSDIYDVCQKHGRTMTW